MGGASAIYALASLTWTQGNPSWTTLYWGTLASSFLYGYYAPRLDHIWEAFLLFLLVNIIITQLPNPWLDLTYGIFGNANAYGCALALGVAVAIILEYWLFVPICLGMILYTQSRGAILGAGAIFLISLWSRHKVLAVAVATLAVALIIATSDGRSNGVLARMGIWEDTLNHLTVFGSGLGSFQKAYASWPVHINMTGQLAQHAYNDFLELLFELGIGFVLFIALVAVCLDNDDETRLFCYTFLALSLTFFPLYIPPLGQLFACALGYLGAKYANR